MMKRPLLLAAMIIFAVSEGAAHESIIKKYQNDLASSSLGDGGPRQQEPLKLAMGPVSAPHLPSGSPNNPPTPSAECPSPANSCANQHVKTLHRRKHH
jgi:hypothetical protein